MRVFLGNATRDGGIRQIGTRRPSSPRLFPCSLTWILLSQVRMVEARPGIAFVEYENEMQSGVALNGLQGFKVTPTNAMAITYAKQ